MARILIILGHPRNDSYCGALADAYAEEALSAGASVDRVNIADLDFDAVADVSYWSGDWNPESLEPDLARVLEKVRWAERIVIVFPLWWGFMPTLFKGFFDRAFSVPGFGAEYDENGRPVGLLKGRIATIVVTHDAPVYWEKWWMRNRGIGILRHSILGLCGIKTDRVMQFGPMDGSSTANREKWLQRVRDVARSTSSKA